MTPVENVTQHNLSVTDWFKTELIIHGRAHGCAFLNKDVQLSLCWLDELAVIEPATGLPSGRTLPMDPSISHIKPEQIKMSLPAGLKVLDHDIGIAITGPAEQREQTVFTYYVKNVVEFNTIVLHVADNKEVKVLAYCTLNRTILAPGVVYSIEPAKESK